MNLYLEHPFLLDALKKQSADANGGKREPGVDGADSGDGGNGSNGGDGGDDLGDIYVNGVNVDRDPEPPAADVVAVS